MNHDTKNRKKQFFQNTRSFQKTMPYKVFYIVSYLLYLLFVCYKFTTSLLKNRFIQKSFNYCLHEFHSGKNQAFSKIQVFCNIWRTWIISLQYSNLNPRRSNAWVRAPFFSSRVILINMYTVRIACFILCAVGEKIKILSYLILLLIPMYPATLKQVYQSCTSCIGEHKSISPLPCVLFRCTVQFIPMWCPTAVCTVLSLHAVSLIQVRGLCQWYWCLGLRINKILVISVHIHWEWSDVY